MKASPRRAAMARATLAAALTAAVAITIGLGASGRGSARPGASASASARAALAPGGRASATAQPTAGGPAAAASSRPAAGAAAGGQAAPGAGSAGRAAGGTLAPVGGPELARPGVIVNYSSPHTPRVPKVPASAFVVADATTGQVLAAENPHAQYGPASTLKILTAISLVPVLNPNATVIASKRAVSVEPDLVGLKQGQRYKISDLFRALLLISGNDAAVALAEATGSFSRGIALMNAEAQHLQAYDTVARQPNGLDAPGQHVSAYDQALIARQALRTPAFLAYDETPEAWFPITPRHRIQLFNQDLLLTEYPGFIGGKTGWTTPAMATFVGMARRHGHTLIVTLLHAVPGTIFNSATELLNWGFQTDGTIKPVGWLVNPLPAPAPSGRPPASHTHQMARHRAANRARTAIHGLLAPVTVGCVAALCLALAAYGIRSRRAARD